MYSEISGMGSQLKGKLQELFGKLTGNEPVELEGKLAVFAGKLQAAYGYSRVRATAEVQRLFFGEQRMAGDSCNRS